MADKVFQNNAQLAVVLEDKDCHSDIEDGPDGSAPICLFPAWWSIHLTEVLYSLDKMVQTQATHQKTIETHKKMFARSKQNHSNSVGGVVGVARDWPKDCYDQGYWNGLSQFEQDTISKVPAVNIEEISKTLANQCQKGNQTSGGGGAAPDQGTTSRGKKRVQSPAAEVNVVGGVAGPSGSMNVD